MIESFFIWLLGPNLAQYVGAGLLGVVCLCAVAVVGYAFDRMDKEAP